MGPALCSEIMDILNRGEKTAKQIAEQLSVPPRVVLGALNKLRSVGVVIRRVDVDGIPVARWSR